jgi:hypothetical protein
MNTTRHRQRGIIRHGFRHNERAALADFNATLITLRGATDKLLFQLNQWGYRPPKLDRLRITPRAYHEAAAMHDAWQELDKARSRLRRLCGQEKMSLVWDCDSVKGTRTLYRELAWLFPAPGGRRWTVAIGCAIASGVIALLALHPWT